MLFFAIAVAALFSYPFKFAILLFCFGVVRTLVGKCEQAVIVFELRWRPLCFYVSDVSKNTGTGAAEQSQGSSLGAGEVLVEPLTAALSGIGASVGLRQLSNRYHNTRQNSSIEHKRVER